MTRPRATPQIYVVSLSDYNNGDSVGRWVDALDGEDMADAIAEMLKSSMQPDAEEWAIHDWVGFYPVEFGEFEPLERMAEIGRGLEEHGTAFGCFVQVARDMGLELDQFGESYRGEWDSIEDWAQNEADDNCSELMESADRGVWPMNHAHIDWTSAAQELMSEGYEAVSYDGVVHVFETNL